MDWIFKVKVDTHSYTPHQYEYPCAVIKDYITAVLRVPKRLLNLNVTSAYFGEDSIPCRTTGEYLILPFYTEVEDYEWVLTNKMSDIGVLATT